MSEPRGMYDMTGWERIECAASDDLRSSRQVTVASSLTDPRANYSTGVTFTEWWADDQPLLRDYLYPDARPCEHYAAHSHSGPAVAPQSAEQGSPGTHTPTEGSKP